MNTHIIDNRNANQIKSLQKLFALLTIHGNKTKAVGGGHFFTLCSDHKLYDQMVELHGGVPGFKFVVGPNRSIEYNNHYQMLQVLVV